MGLQPAGTLTFLFTDIEGSTSMVDQLGAERFGALLGLHEQVLREAIGRFGGHEVRTEGDSFFVAFPNADAAVAAAAQSQQALARADWRDGVAIRVRMGLHTGEALTSGSDYVGIEVHRAARVMSAGHGGQVLVSQTTAALLDCVPLRDLGPHRLKDLLGPVRVQAEQRLSAAEVRRHLETWKRERNVADMSLDEAIALAERMAPTPELDTPA